MVIAKFFVSHANAVINFSFFNETITDMKNFIPNDNMICDDRNPPGMNRRIKTIILAKDRGYRLLARKSSDINLRNSFNNLQKKLNEAM